MFSFETFKELYQNETDDFISKALYRLRDEDLVSVYAADNVAYNTVLLPQGIAYCEENNFLKTGYKFAKKQDHGYPNQQLSNHQQLNHLRRDSTPCAV